MNAANAPLAIPHWRRGSLKRSAGAVLGVLLLAAVGLFGCWLIGMRALDVGTDTDAYARFYESLGPGLPQTRLEAGFVYLSYALKRLGLGVIGYQTALFALLLGTIVAATRTYHRYLGATYGYQTLLCAALMLLFVSPMFVNASINAIRQGLAALLVFASLLCFQRRKWWGFALYGVLAGSLHLSSLLYLACAPVLLLPTRTLRIVAGAAFVLYVSGASMYLFRAAAPSLYHLVMEYTAHSIYRSGVRIDFAIFTIFWYVLPFVLSPLVAMPFRQKIMDSTSVYLAMALPFFMVGWGFFSNRYLLPGWLATSLILAAVMCHCRLAPLRNPLLIRVGLVASCAVLYLYVSRGIVI